MIAQESFTEALVNGAAEVFETMMFMMLEPLEQTEGESEEPVLLGSITFTGPLEGCLSFSCGTECARQIAVNMMALEPDEEVDEDQIRDAIGEVANMVMGSFKAKIMDEVGDLHVSVPSVVSGTELRSSMSEQSTRVIQPVMIDEWTAELSLLYRESSSKT